MYAALPQFTAGNDNRKEPKIILCYNGHQQIVDRNGADALIKKGAYLGECESADLKKNNRVADVPVVNNSFAAFPNPSSGQIQFSFVADVTGPITLDLYDANGKLVQNVYRGNLQKGNLQEAVFIKGNFPAGIYVASLRTNSGIVQKKIVFTR